MNFLTFTLSVPTREGMSQWLGWAELPTRVEGYHNNENRLFERKLPVKALGELIQNHVLHYSVWCNMVHHYTGRSKHRLEKILYVK